ncbi:hypothetical protein JCM10207_003968 [Rhodosporidiobolus poonsookiae]
MLSSSSRPTPSSSSSTAHSLAPAYILRGHAAPVSVLRFSSCARYLYSADTDGFVGVWNLRTCRLRWFWKASVGGVLSVEEWDGGLLVQGRDNELRFFRFPRPFSSPSTTSDSTAPSPSASAPSPSAPSQNAELRQPEWTMRINAMNFCRMSVLSLSAERGQTDIKGKGKEREGLVALPSLTKDDFVDIFHVPSQARIHRSVGAGAAAIGEKTGSVMAVHLFHLPSPSSASPNSASPPSSSSSATAPSPPLQLHLLIAFESGALTLFRFTPTKSFSRASPTSSSSSTSGGVPDSISSEGEWMPLPGRLIEEGEGWEVVWSEKGHRDAVMSLAVSLDKRFAYTVAADHFVCKYRILDLNEEEAALPRMLVETTTSPGKSAVAVREDGKLVATAGWDGETRLYSARTLSPLAVLSHHRTSLQALAFAPLSPSSTSAVPLEDALGGESDSEEEGAERSEARAWLAMGGQETKISLWEVYPPTRGKA